MPQLSTSPRAALVVTPHPLTLQGQRVLNAEQAMLDPKESLQALLARHGVDPHNQWAVSIDGRRVPDAMWRTTWPSADHLIEARRVPEKDALRLLAFAALSYFTFGTGIAGVGGGLGTGGLFASGGFIGGGSCVGPTLLLGAAGSSGVVK